MASVEIDRPRQVRIRHDLVINSKVAGERRCWIIKDPISLNYFELNEEEWFVFQQIDGQQAMHQIRSKFACMFPPKRLSTNELFSFIARLHDSGLVLSETKGQGKVFLDKSDFQWRHRFGSTILSPLSIRLPGFHAGRLLTFLEPVGKVLFHPITFILFVFVNLLAIALLAVEAETFSNRLANIVVFRVENLFLIALVIASTKLLHEFGHALACRRFGAECNEIGIMLLAFFPCLYCNVSDSWTLGNRWHRIIVAAAGIYVEWFLAVFCFFGWYVCESGIVSQTCLCVVILCTVNTLLLNGNPLLRYDGYFILSDLVQVPNLFELSRNRLREWFERKALGIEHDEDDLADATSNWLILYATLSITYRVLVVCVLIWFVHRSLDESGLRLVGDLIAAITLLGIGLSIVRRICREANRWRFNSIRIRNKRLVFSSLCAVGFGSLLFVPIPHTIRTRAELTSTAETAIHAPTDGRLVVVCRQGDFVHRGEIIATIENPQSQINRINASGTCISLEQMLSALKRRAHFDPRARNLVPTVQATLDDARQRLITIDDDFNRSVVRAPIDGVFISQFREPSQESMELPSWQGSLFEPHNKNCYVERGDRLGVVCNPKTLEASLILTEDQVGGAQIGNRVSMILDQSLAQIHHGTIVEVSEAELHYLNEGITNRSTVQFIARASFDGIPETIRLNSQAKAKIHCASASIVERGWNWTQTNIRFR